MKILTSAAAALATLALSSSAFAETLDYDFQMTIDSISDGYGVFDGLSEGGTVHVSVALDTSGPNGSSAAISVAELGYETSGWMSSWSNAEYNNYSEDWSGYAGTIAGTLDVNGIEIHSGSVHQQVYLNFGKTSSGEFGLLEGTLNLWVRNGSAADLSASYVPGPPATAPELDPNSGMAAFALVGGGVTIAWSRRRRQLSMTSQA